MPSKMFPKKRFFRNNEGATAIIFGLSIFVLVMLMGVAVDMARGYIAKSKAISALDAATIAAASVAASDTSTQMQAKAEEYFDANFPPNYMGVTRDPLQINYDTSIDPATNKSRDQVSATVNLNLPTVFGSFHRKSKLAVAAASTVKRSPTSAELALVLDMTPSMCNVPPTSTDPRSCSLQASACDAKYGVLKQSVSELFSIINAGISSSTGSGDIAQVWYAGVYFKGGTVAPYGYLAGHAYDDVTYNWGTPDQFHDNVPLDTYWNQDSSLIMSTLNGYRPNQGVVAGHPDCFGETSVYSGLQDAYKALDPNGGWSWGPRPESPLRPLPWSDKENIKVILLLTDGAGWRITPEYQADPSKYMTGYYERPVDFEDGETVPNCQILKNLGVVIYVIGLTLDDTIIGPDGLNAQQRLTQCASPGLYYNVTDPAQLTPVFKQIADSFLSLRISQ